MRKSLFTVVAIVVAAAAAAVPSAVAQQCPRPDLLDCGPCWTPAMADLPVFTGFTLDSRYVCWRNCAVESVFTYGLEWSPLKQVRLQGRPVCSIYKGTVRLLDPLTGLPKYVGTMALFYSRTWVETDPTDGHQLQVWRFLFNGNLIPDPNCDPIPCPTPPCVTSFGNFRVWGYYEKILDCVTFQNFHAGAMTHECDSIDHVAGSARAGTFHPDRSYTAVWPGAGFTPTTAIPFESGPIPLEAVRPLNLALLPGSGDICVNEEPASANLNFLRQYCACMAGPNQYVNEDLTAFGLCGTTINSAAGPFPFPGYHSKAIGFWTLPFYPGTQRLRLNFASLRYDDPCRPRSANEIFYGVCTQRHNLPFSIPCPGGPSSAPLPPNFLDMGNSRRRTRPFPGVQTTNIKYASDLILNFNPTMP
jgi:hypothetical protein